MNVDVPIVFKGEELSPGVKKGNAHYLFVEMQTKYMISSVSTTKGSLVD